MISDKYGILASIPGDYPPKYATKIRYIDSNFSVDSGSVHIGTLQAVNSDIKVKGVIPIVFNNSGNHYSSIRIKDNKIYISTDTIGTPGSDDAMSYMNDINFLGIVEVY